MNSGNFKRAMGLVLIYIGVFIAIVFVQFARSPGFLAKSGRLSVTASYPAKERKGPPSSVKISYAGLVFELSPAKPAQFQAADGSLSPAVPRAVEKISGGARILFKSGGELRVTAGPETLGSPSFRMGATKPSSGATALVLPYDLSGNTKLIDKARKLVLDSSSRSFEFSFPSGSLDTATASVTILFGDSQATSGLALSPMEPPAKAPASQAGAATAQVKAQAPTLMDAASYKAVTDAWIAKAWQGFSAGRWDGEKGGWKDAAGVTGFGEKALVAYLAEAASRGYLPDALAKVRSSASRNASSLGYLSAPYLGNTVNRMEAHEAADAQEARRIAGLVAAKDPAFLEKEGIVHFLVDRMTKAAAQDALKFVLEIDPSKLALANAQAYLAAAQEASGLLSESENPFTQGEAAAKRLAEAAVKVQDSWYLKQGDDGACDVRLSLKAGLALGGYGAAANKDSYTALGQALVLGVLNLADPNGFLPSSLTLPTGAAQLAKAGSLAPEDFYPLVASNPNYPHEISFYREVGQGAWAWTTSPAIQGTFTPGSSIFQVRYPVGQAHYMAIYGLKPFENIKLYGINYSPDSGFESYDVSGYLYVKSSNALYLKMKHKQEIEKIELYY